jgi:hypothetical protein
MQIPFLVARMLLGVALVAPTLLCAQFQEPTSEELKMTADPQSPGAAAIYLNIEEIANDPLHYQSHYARIKVLAEKGKSLATVEVYYLHGSSKITDITGRTIHADGTVIPLSVKAEDLLVSKSGEYQVGRKVFTLPSVEVGSILEYSYEVRYDDDTFSSPSWEIQRTYPVRKAHYAFTPFKGFLPGLQNATSHYLVDGHGDVVNTLLWWQLLPKGVSLLKADASGRYNLEVNDIPAAPDEEWMPPIGSTLYHLNFYYLSAHSMIDYWMSQAKRWSKEVDHFAEPSKTLKDAVAGLVAPGDSQLEKAKKLYAAVQALDNTDYSRKKSASEMKQLKLKEAKRAEDTWTQKNGDSHDIALLYLALARAAGLTAYDMKVANRQERVFDIGYLNFNQLDDDIVIVNIDGKTILLDPGEKMCPFETVSWRHSGTAGVRQNADARDLATSPNQLYTSNKIARTGDITLDATGSVSGNLHIVMSGQEALRWRQMTLESDMDEVKKQFDRDLESQIPDGVEAHVDHFLGIEDSGVNLIAVVNLHGTLGTATAKRILLPGFFLETRGGHPFVNQEKRQVAVDMHYGDVQVEQIVYHLPNGFTVEGAPQDSRISWKDHAIYVSKSASTPNQITIARQLARAFAQAKPEEYQDLRGFYQKVAAADQSQLVLTRTSAAKGN